MREAVVRERSFWGYSKCCSVRGVHCRPEIEFGWDTLHTCEYGYPTHITKKVSFHTFQRDTLHTIKDKKTDSTILNRDSSVSQGCLVYIQEPC